MTKGIIKFPNQRQTHEQACAWMIRLDGDNELTAEELESLRQWLREDTTQRDELLKLAQLWGRMNVLTELAVPLDRDEVRKSHWQIGTAWSLIAACAIVVTGLFLWLPTNDPQFVDSSGYRTAIGEQQRKTLADGSVVELNTNSRIEVSYSDNFRDVRLLQGEAHFVVAKDADRPFRVFAGVGSLQAIGTSFAAYLNEGYLGVVVTEGKVRVDTGSNQTTLAAGQTTSIRTEKNAGSVQTEVVINQVETIEARELSKRLSWREGILTFNADTLASVVDEMSRYTTLSIEFSDPSVKSIRIGGRFPVGETEAMLQALESNFNLQVSRVGDNRVMLSRPDL